MYINPHKILVQNRMKMLKNHIIVKILFKDFGARKKKKINLLVNKLIHYIYIVDNL